MSAIAVRDVFQVYRAADGGVAALRGLSLTVEAGEVVAVYGPSGSGKSTLMRLLAGLEIAVAGIVEVLGVDLGALPDRDRALFRSQRVGFVDQHYDRALSMDLRCREIVALQAILRGVQASQAREHAERLLDRVGLGDRVRARPRELSGGEQQRVAVAAALAHAPGVLLADEPAGELDAGNARTIHELLRAAGRETGAAVVIVTHDEGAATYADRAVRLRDGRISEEDDELVMDDAGWIRIPPELRAAARLGRRSIASARCDGLALRSEPGAWQPIGASSEPERRPRPGVVVRTARLGKEYGAGAAARRIFDELSLRFDPGLLTAIVGRSGSGKSTLLRILAGLERTGGGVVQIDADQVESESRLEFAARRRTSIAVVVQNPGLVPYLTARENVALGLVIRGQADPDAAAEEWLRRLGLGERLDLPASGLSGGERQRVAIARALASDASLLLLDEPTSRLDEHSATVVSGALREAARAGATVVCATHEAILIDHADDVIDLAAHAKRAGDRDD